MFTGIIIQVVSLGFTMGYSGVTCGKYGGVYQTTPSGIEIYVCDLGDGNLEYYKRHEIGHYVGSTLTPTQKEEYRKLWEKHRKLGIKAFYRDYGMVSVGEGFADDYARIGMKNNRYINQRIKLIKSFIPGLPSNPPSSMPPIKPS